MNIFTWKAFIHFPNAQNQGKPPKASGATISKGHRIYESPSSDDQSFASNYHMVQDVHNQEISFGDAEANVSEPEYKGFGIYIIGINDSF